MTCFHSPCQLRILLSFGSLSLTVIYRRAEEVGCFKRYVQPYINISWNEYVDNIKAERENADIHGRDLIDGKRQTV
jgi:hypothetical protein